MKSVPVFLGLVGQFVDHHHRGVACAASFGLASAVAYGAEGGFNGIGGPEMSPVCGREIVKREQHVLVFFQARTRFGVFGIIQGQEVLVSILGILSGG